MKKQRTKKLGMTILEGVVSGAIMVGVIVMSFEVMVTGVKVSKKATNDATANEDSRSVLEQFVKDVTCAEAIVAEAGFPSAKYKSGQDTLILKQPVFDTSAVRRPNELRYVIYTKKDCGTHDALTRLTAVKVNGVISKIESQRTLSGNLDSLRFTYFNTETIPYDPLTSGFVLPGKDINSDYPPAGKISIRRVKPSWTQDTANSRSGLLGILGNILGVADHTLKISGMKPGDNVEISYALRPSWTKSVSSDDSKATQVTMRIETKEDSNSPIDSSGTGDLITTATCRNIKS